jgi:hypothetical protein
MSATITLYPVADATQQWGVGSDKYLLVDDPRDNPDDTTTKIITNQTNRVAYFTASGTVIGSIGDVDTINYVTLYTRGKGSGGWKSRVRVGDSNSDSSIYTHANYTTENDQFNVDPNGSAWSKTTLESTRFGVVSDIGFLENEEVTQIFLEVTYTTAGAHSAPSSLQTEYQTNPTMVSDSPHFTAKFNDGGTATAHQAFIQINTEGASAGTTNWGSGTLVVNSGTINISETAAGSICSAIFWDKHRASAIASTWVTTCTLLSTATYWWRIKFRDKQDVDSTWSTANTFRGFRREWVDDDYVFRRKITANGTHLEVPVGFTGQFKFKTGNREIIATDGSPNESIQASGGFSIETYGNNTHIAYLSCLGTSTSNAQWDERIVTINNATGERGQPFVVNGSGTYFDAHHFPVICVDNSGYIHMFYGCHYSNLRYIRSKYPNESGSLKADRKDHWIDPNSGNPAYISLGSGATYPIGFVVPDGRIFVFYRYGGSSNSYVYRFVYSDNNGINWNGPYNILDDTHSKKYRVYMYGVRYDKVHDRLHISWTYNHDFKVNTAHDEREMGIWYAFSDLDATATDTRDVGFNIWRWADNEIAGYTANTTLDAIGQSNSNTTNGTSVEGWNRTVDKAIKYTDGCNASVLATAINPYLIFTENLTLTRDGEPVIFWEQKINPGNPAPGGHGAATEETDICCARWTKDVGPSIEVGSWDISNISQDHNTMLRVRRSGLGVMGDTDGKTHMYMPVSAQTYQRYLPTSDIKHTNCSTFSTPSFYEEVDDGLTICDGKTSYVTVGSHGTLLFGHTGTILSNKTILETQVEAVIRRRGAVNSAVKLTLKHKDTENDSDELAVEGNTHNPYEFWEYYRGDFDVCGSVSTLQWGLRNTSNYSFDVSRVLLKIKYTKNTDDEIFGTEIYEFTSMNGTLWSNPIEKSRNSHLGVPIMNNEHHLTQGVIKVIYCSGKDVFLLTNETEDAGFVLSSGMDFKLYYGGNEIDRIVDYPNLNESTVRFRVYGTIIEDAPSSGVEYYIYYGNKNETVNPLADPNNVYPFFENWETTDDSTFPSLQAITVIDDSTMVLSATIGSLLEVSDAYCNLDPTNLIGFKFEIRLSWATTNYSIATFYYRAYLCNTGSFKSSNVIASQNFSIVTDGILGYADCLATFCNLTIGSYSFKIDWYDTSYTGSSSDVTCFIRNYGNSFTINRKGSSNWRFYNSWDESSLSIYETPRYHANKVFAGHNSLKATESGQLRYTLTASIRNPLIEVGLWQETGELLGPMFGGFVGHDVLCVAGCHATASKRWAALYDGSNWAFADGSAFPSIPSRWKNMDEITFNISNTGAVAYYNHYRYTLHYPVSAPVTIDQVAVGWPAESYIDYIRVSQRLAHIVYTVRAFNDANGWKRDIHYNSDNSMTNNVTDDIVESTIGQMIVRLKTKIKAKAYAGGVGANNDYTIRIIDGTTWRETATVVASTSFTIPNLEMANYHSQTSVFPTFKTFGPKTIKVDFHTSTTEDQDTENLWDNIYEYDYRGEPVFSVGDQEVHGFYFDASLLGPGKALFDFAYKVDQYRRHSKDKFLINYLETTSPVNKIFIEYSKDVVDSSNVNMSWIGWLTDQSNILMDVTKVESLDSLVPMSWIGVVESSPNISIEVLKSELDANKIPVEYTEILKVNTDLLVDITRLRSLTSYIPISYIGLLSSITDVNIESTTEVSPVTGAIPIEYGVGNSSVTKANIEWVKEITEINRIPITHTGVFSYSSAGIPIAWTIKFTDENNIPIEYNRLKTISSRMPISYTGQFSYAGKIPIEFRGVLSPLTHKVNIEWGEQTDTIQADIPISFGRGFDRINKLNTEFTSEVDHKSVVPVEFAKEFEKKITSLVEFLIESETLQADIPLELGSGLKFSNDMPLSFSSIITEIYKGSLPIEFRQGKDIVYSTPLEFTFEEAVECSIPIETKKIIAIVESSIPIETISGQEYYSTMPISYLVVQPQVTVVSPVEFTEKFSGVENMPIEFLGQYVYELSASSAMPIHMH